MRAVPQSAVAFLREHEGCVLRVYDDANPRLMLQPGQRTAGTLTAGYGHVSPSLQIGQTVTQADADVWLLQDLDVAASRLFQRIGSVAEELTDNQYAALLSFVFNVGSGDWTIWKRLKARQYDQVPVELMRFTNAAGKKNQGLVNRRAAEVVLWSTDEPGSADVVLTSGATRSMDTPPTPTDPQPARKSATLWGAVTAPVLGVVAIAKDWVLGAVQTIQGWLQPDTLNHGINALTPYSEKSHWVATAVQVLGAICGAVVLYGVFKHKSEARN